MFDMSKSIRGIDEEVFREFKAEAQRREKNLGDAVTEAMSNWLDREEKVSLDEFEAWDWGEGTESLSEEHEEELYGKTA